MLRYVNVTMLIAPVMLFSHDMFFDAESNDEHEESYEEENKKYFVEQVKCMNTKQFKKHFRMGVQTFEYLVGKLYASYQSKVGHPEISLEEGCLICIWYLANLESFRGVAARFGVSKSTAWAAVLRISRAIIALNRRYGLIKWPSRQRCLTISQNFEEKHHIPGIIGAIDGSHIKIVAPKQYPNSYINRKGYHSVVLQGICDHRKLFIDVYVGEAGSVHDYTVFFKSDVSRRPPEDFPNDTHLIGDLAYRLSKTLLVGFKDNGYLTDGQKNFNKTLSKARVIIENAFALLKGRFRRLKYMETIILENTVTIILTASILHNICILNDDEFQDIGNLNEEILGERMRNPRNERDMNIPEENRQALLKRSEIVNFLLLRNL